MSPAPDRAALAADYTELREGCGRVARPRDVLHVAGPEAAPYLQGQCSQDLDSLAVGGTAESLLLSPQGKLDALVRVTRVGEDAFVLDTDEGWGEAARARLERFRLRTKVTVEPLAWDCVALRGAGCATPASPPGSDGEAPLQLPVEWASTAGVDLLGPAPSVEAAVPDGARPCHPAALEALRIEAGVPRMGRELTESTIAAEAGLVDRTVSFTKGCFTGQELVARLDARGNKVARQLCAVLVPDVPALAGDGETVLVGAAVAEPGEERHAGAVSSAAWSPRLGAWVTLATLHRRVTPPAAVVVTLPTGESLDAEARPLPLAS